MKIKRILILFVCILSGIAPVKSQVTIGSLHKAAEGALLDLKDQLPDSDNVTSKTGGLLLPRVELKSKHDFSLPNVTPAQWADHTGLLVYNVNQNLSLEKGIYQWDGNMWKILGKINETKGCAIKKVIYQSTSPDPSKLVSLGIFEFKMIKNQDGKTYPVFRILPRLDFRSIREHLTRYWDKDINHDATGWDDNTGYTARVIKLSATSYWNNCASNMSNLERNEIWIADIITNQIYHVQFMILGNTDVNSNKTYIIIAQKY
jgi:hypothetical protein